MKTRPLKTIPEFEPRIFRYIVKKWKIQDYYK